MAPCDWPLVGCDDCGELDRLRDVVVIPDAGEGEGEGDGGTTAYDVVVAAATEYLWRWTGRAFGLCEVEVRPCRQDCLGAPTTYDGWAGRPDPYLPSHGARAPFTPALVAGAWRNIVCGGCGDLCGCGETSALRLPAPVDSIVAVTIDGETLDPAAYRVDNRSTLIRQDGGRWPTCQNLALPAGEVGTWSVRYRWGAPVPAGGQVAAGKLACEMAKAYCGSSDCELPERIQTVTREGVTVGFLDPFEGLEAGKTGLWLVDSWVASIRTAPARSTVRSPDTRRRRPAVTTYWGSGL
jgi:hypothetical protein